MNAQAPRPLRVVLIEDSDVLRALLSGMLGGVDMLEIVGSADNEADGLLVLRRERPDLVIVDLELRAGSGLGLLAALQSAPERFGSPRAVVFSNHAHVVIQAKCRVLGAVAFFDKSFQMDELLFFVEGEAGARGASRAKMDA